MNKVIYDKNIILNSGTISIIEITDDSYLINTRWINYEFNDDGSKKEIPEQWISLNSRCMVDSTFKKIGNEVFLEEDFEREQNYIGLGLEDIRIFRYNDIYYYIASYFDKNRYVTSMASGIYNIDEETYSLERNIILPNFYDINKIKICEKNWSFFKYKNELCIIYKLCPLQIGKIDYETNTMNIIQTKNMPSFFENMRGSTPGYEKDNEIWFVFHKVTVNDSNDKKRYNYKDCFAVFDLNMKLLRYSELFKLGNCMVEFCTGLIVKEKKIILSYSLMDTNSFVSEYDMETINTDLKWYNN
jgi:hypothetical protein